MAEQYTVEVRDQLLHLASWLPNDEVSIGDIGVMDGKRFIPTSTIEVALGEKPGKPREADRDPFSYRSSGAVSVNAGAGARVPGGIIAPIGKAGGEIEVSFHRENAVLLDLDGCRSIRVEDQLKLQRQILDGWKRGAWKPNWCVAIEVIQVESATILISGKKDASVGLRADAAVELVDDLSLADVSLGLRLVRSDGVGVSMVAQAGATPLLKGLRLKKRFWRKEPKVVLEGLDYAPAGDPFDTGSDEESMFDLLGED